MHLDSFFFAFSNFSSALGSVSSF